MMEIELHRSIFYELIIYKTIFHQKQNPSGVNQSPLLQKQNRKNSDQEPLKPKQNDKNFVQELLKLIQRS